MDDARDQLGRIVRDAWIKWARTQPDPKPSWLVPYDELSEPDKEADRQIAEAVIASPEVLRAIEALPSLVEEVERLRALVESGPPHPACPSCGVVAFHVRSAGHFSCESCGNSWRIRD